MFAKTAWFYDRVYAAQGKDYAAEAGAIVVFVRARAPDAATLLDVACGTGAHLAEFGRHNFACRGIDADPAMVALARARCPEMEIEPGDVLDFRLPERFDVVTCLFGSIAYARTIERLNLAVKNLAAHLEPQGQLFIEPFVSPEAYRVSRTHAVFVDEPDLKVARMNVSRRVADIAILDFHYLIGTKMGIERQFERHELGLFGETAYRDAFEAVGLAFEALAAPQFSRGLYRGVRA